MKLIHINDSLDWISANFQYHEYFAPEFGGGIEFDIPECLVKGEQILRNFFGKWQITSTIREGANQGYHSYFFNYGAVDGVPEDRTKWDEVERIFKEECLKYQKDKSSNLIADLREVGVKGFGIEGTTLHLDYRPDETCHSVDEFGKYCIFTWYPDGTPMGHSEVIL